MTKPKTIMCAIDHTEASLHAARQAFRLRREDVEFVLLGVVAPDIFSYSGEFAETLDEDDVAREWMEKQLAQAEDMAETAGYTVRSIVDAGPAHERIVERAKAEKADLVAMGGQKMGDLSRRLLGTTTSRVIGFGDVDVLVVPEDAELKTDRIMLCTDGSQPSDKALQRAVDIAAAYGGDLTACTAVGFRANFPESLSTAQAASEAQTPSDMQSRRKKPLQDILARHRKDAEQNLAQAKQLADSRNVRTDGLLLEGDPYQALVQHARTMDAGMMVMGSHGRTGLQKVLMGSVAQRIIEHAPCAVYVARS
ncbi:MAG: universal stress protein [Desulfovibrionaceae bacterium]